MTKKQDSDIPPTEPKNRNPDVGRPADPSILDDQKWREQFGTGVAVETKPNKGSTKGFTPGSSLVPDLSKHSAAVARRYFYWIGVTPSCPIQSIACTVDFPKLNESITRGPNNRTIRTPVIGAIVQLSQRNIEIIRERLPRMVIRFRHGDKGVQDEPGTGQNVGDAYIRPRRGFLITIPSEKEIEERKANGLPARTYTQGPHDEPAARYMFAVLCQNQKVGERGMSYPDVIETTGIEWPDEIVVAR